MASNACVPSLRDPPGTGPWPTQRFLGPLGVPREAGADEREPLTSSLPRESEGGCQSQLQC